MLTPVAYGLAVLLDLFCVFIGAQFLLRPRPSAAGYGVPVAHGDTGAYLTVKGIRDASYGVLGLVLLAAVGAGAEAWFMLVVALNPLADTVIVQRNGGSKATAYGIHFATAVVVLLSAALLFAV